jgi:hypothetical protein
MQVPYKFDGPKQISTNKKCVKECVANIILFLFIKRVSEPIEHRNATSCSKNNFTVQQNIILNKNKDHTS